MGFVISSDLQGTRDARARSFVPLDMQGTRDTHVRSISSQDLQDARDVHVGSVAQDPQSTRDAYVQYGVHNYDGDEDEYWGDETIVPDKGKSREVDIDMGPASESILSGMDMEPIHHHTSERDAQDQSIPLNPNSIVTFYNSSGTVKRGRDSDSESIESRQSKVHRRSTSHSVVPSAGQSVPSTKFSSRSGSRVSHDTKGSKSPVDDSDRYGASRTTGGIFRGKATGNVMNWGDIGMYCFTQSFPSVQFFFYQMQ